MAFCKKVTDTRKILLSLFEKISREGKKISGYGFTLQQKHQL